MTYMAHIRDAERAAVKETKDHAALAMLSDKVPASSISKYTELSLDDIHALAVKNNLPFVDK